MSSLTERGHRSQSQQFVVCVCVNVKSEVFKAGHAAVINITEDTNALWIPEHHSTDRDFIGHSSVLFALSQVCLRKKREREREGEKEREGDLHICRVTG